METAKANNLNAYTYDMLLYMRDTVYKNYVEVMEDMMTWWEWIPQEYRR